MVPVILTDEMSQPLAWTCTNHNGQFNFEGLSYGSYLVYADIAGLYSLPEAVFLDESFPHADSVYITMYMESQLSIREPNQELFNILSLYPNPADDMITLNISADESSSVELMVYNQLGQEMLIEAHMIYKGENKLEINISRLPESIYFLRLQAVNSKPLMRTFIKVD